MGHPEIENGTPFAFEPLFLADEEGRPLLAPLVKATYEITGKGIAVAEEQVPMIAEGIPEGEPGKSSYRWEPEGSLPKPATDVVLLGSALAPHAGTTELLVGFQVGTLRKGVRVVGDRVFFKSLGSVVMTKPVSFQRVPLQWERAFGGWDRSHPDEAKHAFEPRNPVGVGFRAKGSHFEEGLRCPNLGRSRSRLQGLGGPPPTCWLRLRLPRAGSRDGSFPGPTTRSGSEARAPLLPKDFDLRFLNAASTGLVAVGHLRGDEQVAASNVTPTGHMAFRLPGVGPPTVQVEHAGRDDARVTTRLDTVSRRRRGREARICYWRGRVPVREPTAVRSISGS